MLFWILLRPRYKIPEFFTIAPILNSTLTVCRRNRGDPSSLYIEGVLQVLQKNILRSGLAWSHPRADRGLRRPTSVFRLTIGVCKILSRSVQIWQYEGQKTCFGVKTENGAGLCLLAVNKYQREELRKTNMFAQLLSGK